MMKLLCVSNDSILHFCISIQLSIYPIPTIYLSHPNFVYFLILFFNKYIENVFNLLPFLRTVRATCLLIGRRANDTRLTTNVTIIKTPLLFSSSEQPLHEGINILQHVYNTYQHMFNLIHIIYDQYISFSMYQNILTEVNLQTPLPQI